MLCVALVTEQLFTAVKSGNIFLFSKFGSSFCAPKKEVNKIKVLVIKGIVWSSQKIDRYFMNTHTCPKQQKVEEKISHGASVSDLIPLLNTKETQKTPVVAL